MNPSARKTQRYLRLIYAFDGKTPRQVQLSVGRLRLFFGFVGILFLWSTISAAFLLKQHMVKSRRVPAMSGAATSAMEPAAAPDVAAPAPATPDIPLTASSASSNAGSTLVTAPSEGVPAAQPISAAATAPAFTPGCATPMSSPSLAGFTLADVRWCRDAAGAIAINLDMVNRTQKVKTGWLSASAIYKTIDGQTIEVNAPQKPTGGAGISFDFRYAVHKEIHLAAPKVPSLQLEAVYLRTTALDGSHPESTQLPSF